LKEPTNSLQSNPKVLSAPPYPENRYPVTSHDYMSAWADPSMERPGAAAAVKGRVLDRRAATRRLSPTPPVADGKGCVDDAFPAGGSARRAVAGYCRDTVSFEVAVPALFTQ